MYSDVLFKIMVLSHIRQFLPLGSKRDFKDEKCSLKRASDDGHREDHLKKTKVNDEPSKTSLPSGKGLTIKLSQPAPVSVAYTLMVYAIYEPHPFFFNPEKSRTQSTIEKGLSVW